MIGGNRYMIGRKLLAGVEMVDAFLMRTRRLRWCFFFFLAAV